MSDYEKEQTPMREWVPGRTGQEATPNRTEIITKFTDELRELLLKAVYFEMSGIDGMMDDPLADNSMFMHRRPDGNKSIHLYIYTDPFKE